MYEEKIQKNVNFKRIDNRQKCIPIPNDKQNYLFWRLKLQIETFELLKGGGEGIVDQLYNYWPLTLDFLYLSISRSFYAVGIFLVVLFQHYLQIDEFG